MSDHRRRRWITISVGIAALLGLTGLCCVARTKEQPVPGSADTQGAEAPASTVAEASPVTTGGEDLGQGIARSADAGAFGPSRPASPSSTANPVARIMATTDEHDRALLADLERTTKQDPSPAVHELLKLRRTGASTAELQAFIDAHFAGDIPVQLAVRRWLREVSEPAGTTPQAKPALPIGGGGNPRRVQPIQPKSP